MERRKIQPDERVQVRLTPRDRELLVEHTFIDPEYAERLQVASSGKSLVGDFTLDDLEDILGHVAAMANHTEDRKLEAALDRLFDKLLRKQRSYDDGNWRDSGI